MTEERVKEFDSELDNALGYEKLSRGALRTKLQCTDRKLRKRISEHKKTVPILWNTEERGYRKAKPIEEFSDRESAGLELCEVKRCIAEMQRKKEIYNQQMRPLIAYEIQLKKHMEVLQ